MRQLKRISFFIYTILLFSAGFYAHMKLEVWLHPAQRTEQYFEAEESKEDIEQLRQEDTPVSAAEDRIRGSAQLVIQKNDLVTGEQSESEELMPLKYVGMNRETLIYCIEEEMNAPTLKERQEGLVSAAVISFSPTKVVLRKDYRKIQKPKSFYLNIRDNRVIVYEEDQNTVYQQTDIDARSLPSALRSEILRGMEISSESDLENFLESYSG